MKNSRILVPVVLSVLLVLSIYLSVDADVQINKEYNEYLDAAHYAVKNDISVDAIDFYNKAIEVKPSIELYIEVGEYLNTLENKKLVQDWAEDILEVYPKKSDAYDFATRVYAETGDYESCFSTYNAAKKRRISHENMEKTISEIEYEYFFSGDKYSEVSVFSGGMCAVKGETKWGYINEKGSVSISKMYNEAGAFISERAPVSALDNSVYYIDIEGNKKVVVPGVKNLKKLKLYNDAVLSGYDGSKWNFYGHDGTELFGGYEDISAFGNGLAAVMQKGKWYIINTKGEKIIDKGFTDILQDEKGIIVRNERLFVKENGGYYMIDTAGNRIGNSEYQSVQIFYGIDSAAAVQVDSKWGFIDKDGNEVIKPQYEAARSFSNGYAAVRLGNKWGFIDTHGNVVINYTFDDVKDFTASGSVFVHRDGYWQLLRLYKNNYS